MRISQMDTKTMNKALCTMAEPIGVLCDDKQLMKTIADITKGMSGLNGVQGVVMLVRKLLPVLLGTHEKETLTIISALTGKTVKQIEKQPGLVTYKEVAECFDKDLIDFFAQSVPVEVGE